MSKERLDLGKAGEASASDFLEDHGYRILARNYKTKLGEIDIIARDKDTICFVEVKTRYTQRFGEPKESVVAAKQRKIARVALVYLKANHLLGAKARFDVVSVTYAQGLPRLELLKNAFELDQDFVY